MPEKRAAGKEEAGNVKKRDAKSQLRSPLPKRTRRNANPVSHEDRSPDDQDLESSTEHPVEAHDIDQSSKSQVNKKHVPLETKVIAGGEEHTAQLNPGNQSAEEPILEESSIRTQRKKKSSNVAKKAASEMHPAMRTAMTKVLIGAHVSSAGGVHNAVTNSIHIGANSFALFLKSQRRWVNPPLSQEHSELFKSNCKSHAYSADSIVPHGSYLVNLAHTDKSRSDQAFASFLDDLSRCSNLEIGLYNIHPGNTGTSTREEAIAHLGMQLNKANSNELTGNVVTLLETMAGSSTNRTLGTTFEDLASIISHVDDKSRIGVCLDTCHVFSAGYDICTPSALSAVLDSFDSIIGLKYLRAIHLNDSKAPFASGKDRHANIGTGFLGLRAFHALMNEPRLWGLAMVLETPIDEGDGTEKEEEDDDDGGKKKARPAGKVNANQSKQNPKIWAREIKLLESLVGMEVDSEEFGSLESQLSAQGAKERKKFMDAEDKKKVKETRKQSRSKKKANG